MAIISLYFYAKTHVSHYYSFLNLNLNQRETRGVHVPHDVIFNHILPRIPAESVHRFKCVSKEWRSFLTSDMFQNKHNRHVDDHKNNPKLLVLSKTETSFVSTTIDCEALPSDKGLTPTRRPLPQFKDTTPHSISILASFHGLVCLGIIKDKYDDVYSDLILWNPLTNEYKRLSKLNGCNWYWYYSDFGLYYSCCEDDYKLLFINYVGNKNFYVYSLKSDSWRKVDDFQHISILYPVRWCKGTYWNENLYFLQRHSDGRLSSIIRFNTKTERLSEIKTPYKMYDYGNAYPYSGTIMVKSDYIHVCVKYDINISGFKRTTCIKLLKLDEYGNMKEVVTYQLRTHDSYNYLSVSSMIPFHLMKNGSWLMRNCSSYEHKIYKVDFKKKKHIKGKGKEKGNIYDDFEYAEIRVDGENNSIVAEEGRYIETFVSPNRYMK